MDRRSVSRLLPSQRALLYLIGNGCDTSATPRIRIESAADSASGWSISVYREREEELLSYLNGSAA